MRTINDIAEPLLINVEDPAYSYNDGLRAVIDAGEQMDLVVLDRELIQSLAAQLAAFPPWVLEAWPAAQRLIVEVGDA